MLMILLATALLLVAVWLLLKHINRKYFILSLVKRIHTQDGSPLESKVSVLPGKTRFGNNFDILGMTPCKYGIWYEAIDYNRNVFHLAMVFRFVRDAYDKADGRSYIWYFLFAPMYNIVRAEDTEDIFQSTQLITKNVVYELLRPFLGDGLLISTGKKCVNLLINCFKFIRFIFFRSKVAI